MDGRKLREYLSEAPGLVVDCRPSVDSTNLLAKAWAREGGALPALFAADRQTAGRGRLGRSFESPEGGLYFSLAIACEGTEPGSLTTLAAVSALKAADSLGIPALAIKWVNDLIQGGRKVGGILTEGLAGGGMSCAVIGIGINAGSAQLGPELRGKASPLDWGTAPPDRERLAALTALFMMRGLPEVPAHMDFYRARCLSLGRYARFEREGRQETGLVTGILDDGALLLQTAHGEALLRSGEASLRTEDGSYF